MRRRLAAIALVAALAAPLASFAETSTAASLPSPKSIELSRQYIKLMGMEERMDKLMGSLLPTLMDDPTSGMTEAGPEMKDAFASALRESTVAAMPKIMDRMAIIYAQTLNEKELQGLVDFYGSAIGHSVLTKSMSLGPAASQVMTEIMPMMKRDMHDRMCAKIECRAPLDTAVTPQA